MKMFIKPEPSIDSFDIIKKQQNIMTIAQEALQRQWDDEAILAEQKRNFRKLISFSYMNVRYYKEAWKYLAINPVAIKDQFDIIYFPILDRDDIQRHSSDMLSNKWRELCSRWNKTSGSTGQPIRNLLGVHHDNIYGALNIRAYHAMGIPWGTRILYMIPRRFRIRSINPPEYWLDLNGFHPTWQCEPTRLDAGELEDLIEYIRPKAIRANPNLLEFAACLLRQRNITFEWKIDIINSYEPLTDSLVDLVESVFPQAVIHDIYGCSEVGDLAWRCSEGGYHVNTDYYIVELIRDNIPVTSGPGEVTVTDLSNYAMPLIRYRVGDLAEWENGICPCKRKLPRFRLIHGRTAPLLELPIEGMISSYEVMAALQTAGLLQFRVRQRMDLSVELYVDNTTSSEALLAAQSLSKLFKERVQVKLKNLTSLGTQWKSVPIISKER